MIGLKLINDDWFIIYILGFIATYVMSLRCEFKEKGYLTLDEIVIYFLFGAGSWFSFIVGLCMFYGNTVIWSKESQCNIMHKKFRIIKEETSTEGAKVLYHPLWYRIEQRHTIIFFIHWWGTPRLEPPHNFEFTCDAIRHIKKHYPKAIIYSGTKN